jgi:hypothetical protein
MGNTIAGAASSSDMNDLTKMALKLDLYAQRIIMKEVKFNSTLSDSGKCEKLIIITSEVLNRLPFRLISYMDRRHKLLSERYEMFNTMDRALLVNTNPEILKESKLDEPNEFRKRQMCVGLARFYVQIGNLFNAIMSTMRPYNYENTRRTGPDNFYDMLTYSLLEGRNASSSSDDKARYETANMSGFTKKQGDMKKKIDRILTFGESVSALTPGAGICSLKRDIEQNKITPMTMSGSSSTENKIKPSIFAMLEELYFDIFHQTSSTNPKSSQFIAMSTVMKEKIYRNDVHQLYRVVTGGKEPGPDIRTFADVARFINDNDEINKWCEKNKDLKINVNDNIRNDSGFVEYIKHVKDMVRLTTKERKAIIGLLDRLFVTMKKSDDELRQLDENWDKGAFRRHEGFERDDEYSREFFRLNLKYDFFINPNLTDADLQAITNEARTRIVRMYSDSYQRFFKGFQILQKIQAMGEVTQLEKTQELAKKGQQEFTEKSSDSSEKSSGSSEKNKINWNNETIQDEKIVSDHIRDVLSRKNGNVGSQFGTLMIEIYNKGIEDSKLKTKMWNLLRRLNGEMREYLDKERIDRNVESLVLERINNIKTYYENVVQPPPQQAQPNRGGIVVLN